jgi:hypothetical protein
MDTQMVWDLSGLKGENGCPAYILTFVVVSDIYKHILWKKIIQN